MKKTWKSNHSSGSCELCLTKQKNHSKRNSLWPSRTTFLKSLICLCGQILAQGKHRCLLLKLHKPQKKSLALLSRICFSSSAHLVFFDNWRQGTFFPWKCKHRHEGSVPAVCNLVSVGGNAYILQRAQCPYVRNKVTALAHLASQIFNQPHQHLCPQPKLKVSPQCVKSLLEEGPAT